MLRRIICGLSPGAQSVGLRCVSSKQSANLEDKILAVELDLRSLSAMLLPQWPPLGLQTKTVQCTDEAQLSAIAQRTVDAAKVAALLAGSQLNRTFSRDLYYSSQDGIQQSALTEWGETPDAAKLEQELFEIEQTVKQLHRVKDAQGGGGGGGGGRWRRRPARREHDGRAR